ncbi:MAG: tetratricopeptide repeat protein [Bacteroidota bacterium]
MYQQFRKLFALILVCASFHSAIFCQADTTGNRSLKVNEKEKGKLGDTYALVIGISKYKNIVQLNYADDDAIDFAKLLTDIKIVKNTNDVRLLIDSEATEAQIKSELRKINSKIKPGHNDRVIIYFAGHGDNDSQTEQGYLLAYGCNDTVAYYDNDAVFIPQLETIVNGIAKNAKVILITDACRSGNLAGHMDGAMQTMKILNDGFTNVTKILSCKPKQLSQEKKFPGGGHGVFTYYLMQALSGLSVDDKATNITITDIENYMPLKISAETQDAQRPIFIYDNNDVVASVDKDIRIAAIANKTNGGGGTVVKRGVKDKDINLSKADSVYYKEFYDHIRAGRLNSPPGSNAYETYKTAKKNVKNEDLLNTMKYDLAAKLEDAVQPLLNRFIRAEFQDYPENLFNEANNKLKIIQDELMDSTDFQYNEIKAKRIFFIASVYKTPRALELLRVADSLMPNSTFISFEIGRYYSEAQQLPDSALKYLNKAIRLSPRWSYPRFMIGNIYLRNKEYGRAQTFFVQAIELQPKFAYALNNLGLTYKALKNGDSANFYRQKAVALDSSLEQYWGGQRKTENDQLVIATLGSGIRNPTPADNSMFAGLLPPALEKPVQTASTEASDGYAFYSNAYYFNKDGNTDSARYWYNKAATMFEKAYTNKTMPAEYYYIWGYTYQALGNYEKAKETYKLALTTVTTELDLYYFGIAWIVDKEGKNEEALQWYKKAYAYNPSYYQAANNIGWAFAKLKNNDSAIYYYRKALKIKPDFTTTLTNIANIYFDTYKDDSAIYYYKKLNTLLSPPDEFAYNRIGVSYDYLGNYDSAIVYYSKAIRVNDKEALFFKNMGDAYYRNKQYEKAIQNYEKANTMLPDSSHTYFNLALSYAYLNNYKKAENIFKESLLKEKGNKDIYLTYYNLGWTMDKQKKLDESLRWYALTVKADPTYINGLNNLGYAYDRLGKKDSAVYWYRQTLKINPSYELAMYNLASLYNDMYKYDSSLYYYKLLLPLAPTDATVPYEIAQLYYYDVNYDSAILYYEKAIKLNKTNANYRTKTGDAYYDATTTTKYLSSPAFYQKAIEQYSEAIRLDSTQFLAMNRLGVSYIYLGKYQEGIKIFKLALIKDAVYKNTYEYNLACIYSLLKDNDKAINYFDRSIISGYRDLAHITEDTDLDNIRNLPAFKKVIEKYFKPDEIAKNPDLYKKRN